MKEFHRTNINLYSTDVEWLQATFGHGWTEKVREWVHKQVNDLKEALITLEEMEYNDDQ